MKRIQTLETRDLAKSLKTGGCGECQTSCQSACKTSCALPTSSAKTATAERTDHTEKLPLDRAIKRHFFVGRKGTTRRL